MATQVSLNSGAIASAGALALQTNGTTQAVSISTGQVATFAQNPILTSGTANGVAYLNGSKVLTTGSALVFDGSNLGLGVTPSAWASSFKVLQLANGTSLSNNGQTSYYQIGANNYYDGTNYKYIASNYAGFHRFSNAGAYEWHTAPSGTAGNAITFTQAMTLDASGNLGIGTSSPAARLSVIAASANSTAATIGGIEYGGSKRGLTIKTFNSAGGDDCGVEFNAANGLAGYGAFKFAADTTTLATIDASGNLLVGTTSGSSHRLVKNIASDQVVYITNTNATDPFGIYCNYSAAAPNSTGAYFLSCQDTSANRMRVNSNGGIANFSANNINLSDRREKTNFAPAKSYLDTICAIPVQTFNYIDQNLKEDDGLTLGVVAQDVQAVAPELVTESNWGTKEEPKMRLSIYQTDLQYALMKCIQEQQSIIVSMREELDSLKSKVGA